MNLNTKIIKSNEININVDLIDGNKKSVELRIDHIIDHFFEVAKSRNRAKVRRRIIQGKEIDPSEIIKMDLFIKLERLSKRI